MDVLTVGHDRVIPEARLLDRLPITEGVHLEHVPGTSLRDGSR